MKHLPKHLRPRYRYLAVGLETWPDASFDRRALQRELWDATRALLGDPGSAAVDPTVLRFDREGSVVRAIVKVRRGSVDEARAAIACIDAVAGDPVGVRVRGATVRPPRVDVRTDAAFLGATELDCDDGFDDAGDDTDNAEANESDRD
jgi:ribonuclease P/MRP protein subunit POP5